MKYIEVCDAAFNFENLQLAPMVHVNTFVCYQQLDPEKIPADFIELGFTEDVLKHECPAFLQDVKDEEVSKTSLEDGVK